MTLSSGRALLVGTYLDLTEAAGRELVQQEDLERQQQARVVSTARLARWEPELELPLGLESLPELGPCGRAPEVSTQGQRAVGFFWFFSLQKLTLLHFTWSPQVLPSCIATLWV